MRILAVEGKIIKQQKTSPKQKITTLQTLEPPRLPLWTALFDVEPEFSSQKIAENVTASCEMVEKLFIT